MKLKIRSKSSERSTVGWRCAVGIVSLMLVFTPGGRAQSGEETFKKTCSACHTVGGGKLVGPDLKGVNSKRKEDWIIKFVKASQSFIKSGDADAQAIFDQYKVVMPDQNLSDADIKSVIAYIASKSPAEAVAADSAAAPPAQEAAVAARSTGTATVEEILLGKQLFEGSTRFVNGGASCVSCHNVNYDGLLKGGMLAKDLTNCYARLGGDAGIMGILGAPPFPAMTAAFKDNPLTEQEIFALTAFLNKADKDQVYQHPNNSNPLLLGGFIGFIIIIILIFLIWNMRKKSSVKEAIYNRQVKSQ
jgi:mono/diheme cytochrome c family protein